MQMAATRMSSSGRTRISASVAIITSKRRLIARWEMTGRTGATAGYSSGPATALSMLRVYARIRCVKMRQPPTLTDESADPSLSLAPWGKQPITCRCRSHVPYTNPEGAAENEPNARQARRYPRSLSPAASPRLRPAPDRRLADDHPLPRRPDGALRPKRGRADLSHGRLPGG